MPALNQALFEPLKRTENAARRASGVLRTAPNVPAKKDEMIAKEIQEIRDGHEISAQPGISLPRLGLEDI
jgi:hypothetical protein